MYGDRDIKHKKRSGFYFIATKNVVLKGTEPRFIIQKAKIFFRLHKAEAYADCEDVVFPRRRGCNPHAV